MEELNHIKEETAIQFGYKNWGDLLIQSERAELNMAYTIVAQRYREHGINSTPIIQAVQYMINVWDEVTPSWRSQPDHVQQKFITAEQSIQ